MKTRRIFFLTILVLALVLRFYQLGGVPPSLNWDEAGMGYNAYSLIKTGGFDEYGEFLPLSFRSFDDYKPPFYTYLTRIPVLLLGLNDFAIRFVSAIMGVLTVIFTYFLVLELFNNWKIALLSMFFLSVSPWHLQFSRVAFEANVAVFFLVAGVWAFLKWVRQNGQWLAISAIFYRPEPLEESIKRIAEDEEMGQKFIGGVIHNRRLAYFRAVVENYLSHFRPEFLFFEADTATHN